MAVCHWADWGHDTGASWTTLCKERLSNFMKILQTVYSLLPGNGQTDGWMEGRGLYVGRSF